MNPPACAHRRGFLLVGAAGLAALIFLAFWPVIIRQQTLLPQMAGVLPSPAGPKFMLDPMAPAWFSYPLGVLANRIWEQGRLPLWNPNSSCGEPLLAGVHAGITSPLRLWQILSPPTPAIWDVYCLVRLFLAGAGALLLGRILGLGMAGAFACAAAYMLSGFMAANVSLSMLDSEALLPLLAVSIINFIRKPDISRWAWLSLSGGAILLLGNPQVALVDGIFAVMLSVACMGRRRIGAASGIIPAGLTAMILAGPALLPVLDFLPRAQHIHAEAGRTALPLWGAVSLAAPWLLGRFGEPWAGLNPFLFLPHAGLAVIVLGFLGTGRAWKVCGGAALCLTPLLLLAATFGIPPVSWLGRLPGVSMMWWAKYQAPTYLCLAALAGFGVDRLDRSTSRRVLGVGAGWAAALFMSAELVWLVPATRPSVHDPLKPAPYVDYLRGAMDVAQERLYATGAWLHPQSGAALGLPDIRSFYSMMPRRTYWYIRALVTGPAPSSHAALMTGSPDAEPALSSPGLAAMGVRWIVSDPKTLYRGIPAGMRVKFKDSALVLENRAALSRARLVSRAIRVGGPEEALYLASGDPAGRDGVRVEAPVDWEGYRIRGDSGPARILACDSCSVTCLVPGSGARLLLLADTWEKGWKAFVGGRRIPVFPADCMFRIVLVPPGENLVEFYYDPVPVKLGILGFGLSLALCAAILTLRRISD